MKTSQLEEKLARADFFSEELVSANLCPELRDYINECMNERGISRAELIKRLNLDRCYGYQLLNGTRKPTRNHLIQIGFALGMDVERLDRLLKIAGKKSIYVKDPLDARVFFAVKHKMSYDDAVVFVWGDSYQMVE